MLKKNRHPLYVCISDRLRVSNSQRINVSMQNRLLARLIENHERRINYEPKMNASTITVKIYEKYKKYTILDKS